MHIPFEIYYKMGTFLRFNDFKRFQIATRLLNLKFTGEGLTSLELIRDIDYIYTLLDVNFPDHPGFQLIYDLVRLNQTDILINYALKTWLFKAVESSDFRLLDLFFHHNADPNARSSTYALSYSNLLQLSKSAKMTQYLLSKGADPSLPGLTVGSDSLPALHTVTKLEIAKLLISHGANVNQRTQRGFVPLHTAYNVDIAKELVANGADVTTRSLHALTPLHEARDVEIASFFISLGADVNALSSTNVSCLAKSKDARISRLLIENGARVTVRDDEGCTPLHHAKSAEQIKVLLNNGAEINALNSTGASPLLYILQHCPNASLEMVKELVDSGADVTIRDQNGYQAIRLAKTFEMCVFLIENGADVLATDIWGMNCLFGVKTVKHAELLVKSGLDPANSRDCSGRTPLHCCHTVEVAKYFVSLGADVNVVDKYGRTPIQEIQAWGRSETKELVIDYLVSMGGLPKPATLLEKVYSTGVFD